MLMQSCDVVWKRVNRLYLFLINITRLQIYTRLIKAMLNCQSILPFENFISPLIPQKNLTGDRIKPLIRIYFDLMESLSLSLFVYMYIYSEID